MSERRDDTLERLEARVKEIWQAAAKAVHDNDLEGIAKTTEDLQGISLDFHLSRRLRAAEITRQTLTWLRDAWPEEGWPEFHRDLARVETGLNEALEAKDLSKIDWWLNEAWTLAMPCRTQDARVHNTRRADPDPLGLAPQVRALIEGRPEPEGQEPSTP